jgi:hypothetical protein
MLLHRTPPKAGPGEVDPAKPVKWLRCLQCAQKFPEHDFRAHQRESKSPCELVRVWRRLGPRLLWLTEDTPLTTRAFAFPVAQQTPRASACF